MRRAFHLMRNGKPGPVLIEVPGDMTDAEAGAFDYCAAACATARGPIPPT